MILKNQRSKGRSKRSWDQCEIFEMSQWLEIWINEFGQDYRALPCLTYGLRNNRLLIVYELNPRVLCGPTRRKINIITILK